MHSRETPDGESWVIAVDLGGTLTKVGRSLPNGDVHAIERVPTGRTDGAVDPGWLTGLVADRIAAAPGSCVAYGVVTPGIVDGAAGVVRVAPNLGWTGVPLRARLSDALGLPGALGHDVRAGGRAEWRRGSGVGCDNLLFLPLGTGIAGAAIVDGRLLEADGYAGEIGHLRVGAAGDRACACGLRGCLETVASATGVSRSYATEPGLGADRIAERARAGDAAALAAYADAGTALGEALAAYVAVAGPELIVIGGGLAAAGDLFLPRLEAELAGRLSFHRRPVIRTAALGADAGLVGAGLAGWDVVGEAEA